MRKDTYLDKKTFLAILEYIYTDHAPIEETDPLELLVLADRYNIQRLVNLCELYITKMVDRHCTQGIERSDVNVIGILNLCNVSFCHFALGFFV